MGRAPEPHTQPLLPTLTPTLRCAPLHTLTHPTNRPASQRQQPTQTASHPPTHLQADANSRCKQTFSCPRALLNTNKHWSFLVRCFFRLISVTSEVQVRGGWVWEWECRVSWQWYGVFITGPPALSAFPYRHNEASCIDRLPCGPCERCFVVTCRYSLPEISTRRLRLTAPILGPLLGSTFDPLNYVPQLWGDIVSGVCF